MIPSRHDGNGFSKLHFLQDVPQFVFRLLFKWVKVVSNRVRKHHRILRNDRQAEPKLNLGYTKEGRHE
ncbi:hypothetical protein ACHAXA_003112 [Cyclostephanos tholiformis]|uniref:Uncharacterized protein n=1 Tax=Cyclostephanos tholiformis TaxID=382380 RepID=A0ABD3SSE7_9STRA